MGNKLTQEQIATVIDCMTIEQARHALKVMAGKYQDDSVKAINEGVVTHLFGGGKPSDEVW